MMDANCSVTSADYQYQLFPIVYGVALVLGLPGNLVALFIFLFKVTPRTSSDVYIINLAVADMAILLTLPFRIHYHLHRNNWVFGDVACLITGTLWHANIYISVCFMTCICVDRYMAAVHPHRYLRLKHSCHSVVVSALLWGFLCVAMLTFILMGPLETKNEGKGPPSHSCFENFAQGEWDRRMAPYSTLSLVFCSLLPSVVILVCYPLAMRRISQIRSKTAHRARRIIYVILAITLLCFLPFHVVYLLHLLRRLGAIRHCPWANGIYHARRVTTALVTLNTCLDPVLYCVAKHCEWKPSKLMWWWGRAQGTNSVYTLTRRQTQQKQPAAT